MPRPAAARPCLRTARPAPRHLLVAVLGAVLLLPLSGARAVADDGPEPGAPAVTTEAELAETAAQVADAEREHGEMNALVERTAAVLEEGTARLEAGQAELAALQAEQVAAEAAAQQALARAAAARARLGVVVSASYRSPLPQSVQMALTAGPEKIADAIVARADLDRVQGDSQDLLRKAGAARLEADRAVRRSAQLTQQAAAKEQALAAEVQGLRAVAEQSRQQLEAAALALAAAQTDRQDALAAAEAETRAREAEKAARASAGSYIAATCSGAVAGQHANGMLPASSLCPLDDNPGEALRPDAAAAFNAMNAFHRQATGRPLCAGSTYRDYAGQVAVYAAKPQLAAVPGRSNHGWGRAVDFSCGVERFGSAEHEWMRANAGSFGWFHPGWAQAGGSRPEAWHWEFGID